MTLGKKSIHRKILMVLLSVVLLTFLALGFVSLQGGWSMLRNTQEVSGHFDDKVTSFAEEMAEVKTKALINESAAEKARQVERELKMVREDTEYLANSMTRILTYPERYPEHHLPNPYEKRIKSGESYLMITPKVSQDCQSEAVQREIALASNAYDVLEVTGQFYQEYETSCYYGSKHGYFIGLECYNKEEMYDIIHNETFRNEYDPRQRPWYQLAVSEGKPVFTDVYVGNDGYPEITCAAPYYDNYGLAGAAGLDVHLESLYKLISDRSLGKTNINFAIDSKGRIIFSSEQEGILAVGNGQRDLRKAPEESLAHAAEEMTAGRSDIVLVNVNGEEYYLAYAPLPSVGWSLGTLLKLAEVMAPVEDAREYLSVHAEAFKTSMVSLFLGNVVKLSLLALILFVLFFYGSRMMAERFVRPILALTEGVREIAKGNLDNKLDIRSGDEIEELSDSVNHMTTELKGYMENLSRVTAEKERIATELSLAQGIQESMLPNIFPKFAGNPHYDLFAIMHAAKSVGGDFYDFYNIDETHLAFTIADVSGKGVPASLFMVIAKTVLKNAALSVNMGKDPNSVDWENVMTQANRQLCENNEEMMFVTVFFGMLDLKTGEFMYVNGGHNAPLIGRLSGDKVKWQYIRAEKKSHMVGVIENAVYKEDRVKLNPGDMLFLYTDGVTEAMDETGKLYTEERLQETLCKVATPRIMIKDLLTKVREDIDDHANGADQSDDITMLGIRFIG